MDEIVYDAIERYFNAVSKLGYLSDRDTFKLLVLLFYRDVICEDYIGHITEKDYYLIEKALDCLYGTTCLIPYPEYMQNGKLHLGELSEMAQRIQKLEDTNVLKVIHDPEDLSTDVDSDIVFVPED